MLLTVGNIIRKVVNLKKTQSMEKRGIDIASLPEYLIYELDEGRPIYYQGYQEVLDKTKTVDQIMSSSVLQAVLIELIKEHLKPLFGKEYIILANEIGIQFSAKLLAKC